ncbi:MULTISPECIES: pyrroloquinoline quinone precursor peptide PqqA [Gammaproteobacteria]|nr:pyrroloquinoline quinone precursor peptide PqqA [Pseudomonas aeruginosa]OPE31760.1 coenzyme PQQ precursor peptide PqqA [Pseudomonas aeruginosa]
MRLGFEVTLYFANR